MNEVINGLQIVTSPMDELPKSSTLTGAEIIGIDPQGKPKLFNLQGILRTEKGIAFPGTVPSGARFVGETWPIDTASYGSVFTNFGGLAVPLKVGPQYVANARFVYDNGAWTLQKELVDGPSATDLKKITDTEFPVYSTIVAANAAITNTAVNGKNNRDGRIVQIGTPGNYTSYSWQSGFLDANLIEYSDPLSGVFNLLTRNESQFTVNNMGRWTTSGGVTSEIVNGKLRLTFTAGQGQWLLMPGMITANKPHKISLKTKMISGLAGLMTVGNGTGAVNETNFKIIPTSTELARSGVITVPTVMGLYIGYDPTNNLGCVVEIDDVSFSEYTSAFDANAGLKAKIEANSPYSVAFQKELSHYSGTSIRDTMAFFSVRMLVPAEQKFNAIGLRIWGGVNTRATIRLYDSSITDTLISEMGFVGEWTFGAGELNQEVGEFQNLGLIASYTVAANRKLVAFLFTESGTNIKAYQILPSATGYSTAESFLYINPAPSSPFTYGSALSVSDPTAAAKSEAFKLLKMIPVIKENTGITGDSMLDPELLINGTESLGLDNFTRNGKILTGVGTGIFKALASFPPNTTIDEVNLLIKFKPTATGTGGLEFGNIRRSYLAGSAVTIGNDGTNNFLRIYKMDTDTPALSEQVVLPFPVVVNTEYSISMAKQAEKMIIEVRDGNGNYFLKNDRFQTDKDGSGNTRPTIGGMWGQPGASVVKGTVEVSEFVFTSPNAANTLLYVAADSFGEVSTMEDHREDGYMQQLAKRIGENRVAICGRGGESAVTVSSGVTGRLKYELGWFKKAKYAYLPLGVNDGSYDAWLAAMQSNIAEVKSAGMIPLLATITHRGDQPSLDAKTAQQNAWIKASGYKYADIRAAVTNPDGTWKAGAVMTDLVHLSIYGNQLAFNRICLDFPFLLRRALT